MIVLAGRLKGYQRAKVRILYDMLYKPSELAHEIGFSYRQVLRVYLPLGCPCERVNGHIFINGKLFAEWYESTYPKYTLLQDEAFCLTCKQAVKMDKPQNKKVGRLSYWVCSCPACGRKLSRIIDKEKR
jgi:hypothetical protein